MEQTASSFRLPKGNVLLSTYFLGNGETGVYLAYSEDGDTFVPLLEPNPPVLTPMVGKDRLMRDSCLLRGPDRRWHLVWTTGWWDSFIGISHSSDLLSWETQRAIPVMDAREAVNAWAPEIAFEPKTGEYVIFWSSTIRGANPETIEADGHKAPDGTPLNHRFFMTTTKDFKSYSPTRLMWDPGFNCIDATLMPSRHGWTLFGKDETLRPDPRKWLFSAVAPTATGPFKVLDARISGNYWAEGPTAISVNGITRVYFDRYTQGNWGAVESNEFGIWTEISDRIRMVKGARHGTVVQISKRELEALKRKLAEKRA